MIRMAAPPSLFVQGGSWRATRHLLIRALGASGKVARGGHVTSSGSQPTVYRRPARTFVLPAPRVPDGLTISPAPFREQADSNASTDHIPDNGQAERIDLPLNFHPAALRASAGLVCYPTLDRRKVEFSGLCHASGLDAPAGVMREAGGLLPIAPCGRSSL